MQYEQQYRILKTDGSVIEGQYIQTKGNDQDFPTFLLGDGSRLGVRRDSVLGPVIDDCPVDGIKRPGLRYETFKFVKEPDDELIRKIIHLNGDT